MIHAMQCTLHTPAYLPLDLVHIAEAVRVSSSTGCISLYLRFVGDCLLICIKLRFEGFNRAASDVSDMFLKEVEELRSMDCEA